MSKEEEAPKYQLEDILNKKKPPPQILDLHHIKIDSEEEFKKAIEKIPDYKIKAEKADQIEIQLKLIKRKTKRSKTLSPSVSPLGSPVPPWPPSPSPELESPARMTSHQRSHIAPSHVDTATANNTSAPSVRLTRHQGRDTTSTEASLVKEITVETVGEEVRGFEKYKFPEDTNSQDYLIEPPEYEFANPCPPSMRQVRISDLSSVDINWRMLTLARPETKIEEEIFSKLVHLDKLRLSSRREESDVLDAAGGKDPDIIVKNASESKGGVIEKFVKVCQECGEEFCYGACIKFQYDCYQRMEKIVETDADQDSKQKKGKKGVKKRKKSTRQHVMLEKNNMTSYTGLRQ